MYPREQLRRAMLLYAVTDRAWLYGRKLSDCVAEALQGGVTFVQLREKHASHEETLSLARAILPLCRKAGVPFVIDDDVEAACEVDADGVHVGQDDAACSFAREVLGPDKIVGVSVQTLEQARAAQEAGADYLGVGAMFGTPTKPNASLVSADELRAICRAVRIPTVAIGGLNERTVNILSDTGVDGVAVVSAVFAANDIKVATKSLATKVRDVLGYNL